VRRELATWLLLWTLISSAVAAGIVAGALIVLAIHPGAVAASRPAQQADSPQLPGEMTTERTHVPLPSPDFAGRTGQPDSHPGASTASPVPGRITPQPAIGMRPAPTEEPRTAAILRGLASWYDAPAGGAAAGPDLRAALGPGWRGQSVVVTRSDEGAAVVVRLTDWCACGDRGGVPTLIDLPRADFAVLALPSAGIVRVTVAPIPAPPVTSRETP
jgi:rare lipoprotein A (peptidoglycan hydrolase)